MSDVLIVLVVLIVAVGASTIAIARARDAKNRGRSPASEFPFFDTGGSDADVTVDHRDHGHHAIGDAGGHHDGGGHHDSGGYDSGSHGGFDGGGHGQ
jgi:hypothetical protein